MLWLLGMPSPVMWGGIVAVANYIPYLGPIVCALLLFAGGLMFYPDVWHALTRRQRSSASTLSKPISSPRWWSATA